MHPIRWHKISIFPIIDDVYFHHLFKVPYATLLYREVTFYSFEIIKCFVKEFFETMNISHCSSKFLINLVISEWTIVSYFIPWLIQLTLKQLWGL